MAAACDEERGEVDGDGEADEESANAVKPIAFDLAGGVKQVQKDQAEGEAETANGDEAAGSGVEVSKAV